MLRCRLLPGLLLGTVGVACGSSSMPGAPASPAEAAPGQYPAFNAPGAPELQDQDHEWHRPMHGEALPPPAAPKPTAPPPPAPVQAEEVRAGDIDDRADKAPPPPPPPVWAPVREFPVPSYSEGYDGPRIDFRETVFWAPSIKTDDRGEGQVDFFLNDSVSSFRAIAEGTFDGAAGRGEAVISSKLPVSIATKLPTELSSGDEIDLPVTITNSTARKYWAAIHADFGPAFEVTSKEIPSRVELEGRANTTLYYALKVQGGAFAPDAGRASIRVEAAHLEDGQSRVIKVVPAGFPRIQSLAGTLSGASHETVDLADPTSGSLEVSLHLYPTPAATLVAGTEAMIAEPNGCFEQASSTNYPNVMVMGYLASQDKQQYGALVAKTQSTLDRGYKKLSGYEAKSRGYEWFGADPGHEALTAYGLMQFNDMAKVYKDVDQAMVARTLEWLRSKRDGKGGYERNSKALDSFGGASDEVTTSYITYALTETGAKDLDKEVDYVKKLAKTSKDPYVLALAANTLLNVDPKGGEAQSAARRLAAMQGKAGNYPGASQSITRSGGAALEIETTALATLALMKSVEDYSHPVELGLDYIVKQRSGSGGFGSTQSTVLALKALTKAAERSRAVPEGTLRVSINGKTHDIKLDPSMRETITLSGLASDFKTGKNTIDFTPTSASMKLPYSMEIAYRTIKPASSSKAAVAVSLSAPKTARNGAAVKVQATVTNVTGAGVPMVIARIGIPGGTTYQTWQLKELVDKKLVDYYETREREVIVYFRGMGPKAKKQFDLDLLATVPGTFTAPASQAYLYYTDELRSFAEPIKLQVTR